ncbi:MAG: hypothetical protein WBD36_08845 [Bacteroidota bacterium]
MKKLVIVLALAAGIFAGYVDLHSVEVYLPVILVLGFAFIFAYLLPSIVWRVALLVGIGIPLMVVAAYYLGYEPAWVEEMRSQIPDFDYDISNALQSVLAFIPSFIGAYGGALVRKVITSMLTKKSPGDLGG